MTIRDTVLPFQGVLGTEWARLDGQWVSGGTAGLTRHAVEYQGLHSGSVAASIFGVKADELQELGMLIDLQRIGDGNGPLQ